MEAQTKGHTTPGTGSTPTPLTTVEVKPATTPAAPVDEEYNFDKVYAKTDQRFLRDLTSSYAAQAEEFFGKTVKEKYGHLQGLIDASSSNPKAMKALEKLAANKSTFDMITELVNDEDEFSYYKDFAAPSWRETQDPALKEVRRIEREMQSRQDGMTAAQKKTDDDRVAQEKTTKQISRRISELTALQNETAGRLRFDNTKPGFERTPQARLVASMIEHADYLESKYGQTVTLQDVYDNMNEVFGAGVPDAAPTSRRANEAAPSAAPSSVNDIATQKAKKLEALKTGSRFRDAISASK